MRYYARLMPIHGSNGVDRCTRMCKDQAALERAIKRQCYAIREPGPYMVMRYDNGIAMGPSTLED